MIDNKLIQKNHLLSEKPNCKVNLEPDITAKNIVYHVVQCRTQEIQIRDVLLFSIRATLYENQGDTILADRRVRVHFIPSFRGLFIRKAKGSEERLCEFTDGAEICHPCSALFPNVLMALRALVISSDHPLNTFNVDNNSPRV